MSCHQVRLTWQRRLVHECAKRVSISLKMSVVEAAALVGCWKREEREAFTDTGRHGCARKLARPYRGNLKMADRLTLVA